MRLKTILTALALLAIFSVSSTGCLYFLSLREAVIQEAERSTQKQAASIRDHFEDYTSTHLKLARALAGMDIVRARLLSADKTVQARIDAILDHFKISFDVAVCYLIDHEGRTIAASNRNLEHSFVGHSYAFRPYFQQALHGYPAVYPALGITSGKRGIFFSHPVYEIDGQTEVLGVLVVKSSVDALENRLRRSLGKEWILADSRGIIFASGRRDWSLRSIERIPADEAARIAKTRQFGSGPWQWTGLTLNKDGRRAVDANGRVFVAQVIEAGISPGWNICALKNLKTVVGGLVDPFTRKIGLITLFLCLSLGTTVIFLYGHARKDIRQRLKAEENLRSSEEKFRVVFKTTPDAVTINRIGDGLFVDVNDGFCAFTGYGRQEVMGLTSIDIRLWQKLSDRVKLVEDLSREGFVRNRKVSFRLKNGQLKTGLLSAALIHINNEDCVLTVTRDIDDLESAKQALEESEAKYRAVVENANEALLVIQDSRIRFFNRKALDLSGYSQNELGQIGFVDFIHPKDRMNVLDGYLNKMHGDPTPSVNVFRVINKDGQVRWAECNSVLIEWEREPATLNLITDITERKLAEEALKEKEAYLRKIMETVQAGVIIIDTDTGKVTDANPFASRMIGRSLETLTGMDADACNWAGENWIGPPERTGDSPEVVDCILNAVDGRRQEIRRTSAPVRIKGINYLVHSFLDITDIKDLIRKQEVNIGLAKKILKLVNGTVDRYIELNPDQIMFMDGLSSPCYSEGGDHYFVRQVASPQDNRPAKTYLSLKDQSGHEVSCILRSIIADLIHNAFIKSNGIQGVDKIVSNLNDAIYETAVFDEDDFFTSMNFEIDHDKRMMRYTSCGHPPFLLIRNGEVHCLPDPADPGASFPISLGMGMPFSADEQDLRTGDKVLLYTDGLTEMPRKNQNRIVTVEQLKSLVAGIIADYPNVTVSELAQELLKHISALSGEKVLPFGENTSGDDVTMLFFEVEDQSRWEVQTLRPSNLEELRTGIQALKQRLMSAWQEKDYEDVEVRLPTVLEEAVLNAWQHGNGCQPGREIVIQWRFGNDFHLEVIDEGEGFDPEKVPDPRLPNNLTEQTGRGIFIIRQLSACTRWKQGGRHLAVSFQKRTGTADRKTAAGYPQNLNLWRIMDQNRAA